MEFFFVWCLFAVFSAVIASSKGRSGFGWFLIGFFFGPFGLVVAFMPSLKPTVPAPANGATAPAELQPLEAIQLLARLRDGGAISAEEYERKKIELLGRV